MVMGADKAGRCACGVARACSVACASSKHRFASLASRSHSRSKKLSAWRTIGRRHRASVRHRLLRTDCYKVGVAG